MEINSLSLCQHVIAGAMSHSFCDFAQVRAAQLQAVVHTMLYRRSAKVQEDLMQRVVLLVRLRCNGKICRRTRQNSLLQSLRQQFQS